MSKAVNTLLGLILVGLGALGLTRSLSLVTLNWVYYVAAVLIGLLGVLVGVYSNPHRNNAAQRNEQELKYENDQLKSDNDRLKREVEQFKQQGIEQTKRENDLLKKEIDQLKKQTV